ncbi:MAG TPA: hydantoinase/oxoprolinase family protein [Methylophilaceae bacterium]|nr:hydantoinase/oxoprolinase family protein [Methylophilaceae bacterium]
MTRNLSHRKSATLGWDVGGAHLKAVLVDADGSVLTAIQVPCRLWQGLDQLRKAIDVVLANLKLAPDEHVVTMTGELADIFANRTEGVMQIAGVMTERFGVATRFYAGAIGLESRGFVASNQADQYATAIASANWLASTAFVATKVKQGLLVDIGSTTADFVVLSDGKLQNRGYSDAERMQFEELIYTGVVRTPLMALGGRVPFAGEWQTLAAEHFATTADVYRLTGDLNKAEDMSDTADGAGKTPEESARRLARMIGRDLNDASTAAWIGLAKAFKKLQLNTLNAAAMRTLSRNLIDDKAPVIGAGSGKFLARKLAEQLNREYLDVETLIMANTDQVRRWASVCLPAYAVAYLAASLAKRPA